MRVQPLLDRARDVARAAAIFLAVFTLYFATYSRELPTVADEMLYFSLTQSIAKWQVVTLDQVSTVGPGPEEYGVGGHRYSKKGPLQSILALPLFWLAFRLPIGAVDAVLLLNHLIAAATVALFFLLVRRFGYSPGVALALAGVLAFSTPLWVSAKRFYSEPTIALCLVATLYAAHAATTSRRPTWLAAAGFAFAAAVAAKNVNALLLVPIPIYLAWLATRGATSARWSAGREAARTLVWFSVGAAPIAAGLMLYSHVRYGTPFSSGYGEWETFSTPVWAGIADVFFSPWKSLFVYTPIFLLLPFWGCAFIRRFGAFGALIGAIAALHILLYAGWWDWWGGGWGYRFIVPILPLLTFALAEGVANARGIPARAAAIGLGLLGVAIQALGVAVHHETNLRSLLPDTARPDRATLYDIGRSQIVHQTRILSRDTLDFAWVEPIGASPINLLAFGLALIGLGTSLACLAIVWRSRDWTRWLPALGLATLIAGGTVYADLRIYYRQVDPAIAEVSQALERAPTDAGVIQMISGDVDAFANWHKRPLPELGKIEGSGPGSIFLGWLADFGRRQAELWVVTETPANTATNGVEAVLTRSFAQIGHDSLGRFRLLRFATRPDDLPFRDSAHRFDSGIELMAYHIPEPAVGPGQTLDLTLAWRASAKPIQRPDYTVFVHLLGTDGEKIAQHDGPMAGSYVPTSIWTAGQVVYDHHPIVLPTRVATTPGQLLIGLYEPATGKRLSRLDERGEPIGDTVVVDLVSSR